MTTKPTYEPKVTDLGQRYCTRCGWPGHDHVSRHCADVHAQYSNPWAKPDEDPLKFHPVTDTIARQRAAPQPVATEREAFEAWLSGHRAMLDGSDQFARYKSDGAYVDQSTALAWRAWQAATPAAPQESGDNCNTCRQPIRHPRCAAEYPGVPGERCFRPHGHKDDHMSRCYGWTNKEAGQ